MRLESTSRRADRFVTVRLLLTREVTSPRYSLVPRQIPQKMRQRSRFMLTTRTPGITVDAAGHRIVDKDHRGVRIFLRLGPLNQEDAEQRLCAEIARVESE